MFDTFLRIFFGSASPNLPAFNILVFVSIKFSAQMMRPQFSTLDQEVSFFETISSEIEFENEFPQMCDTAYGITFRNVNL